MNRCDDMPDRIMEQDGHTVCSPHADRQSGNIRDQGIESLQIVAAHFSGDDGNGRPVDLMRRQDGIREHAVAACREGFDARPEAADMLFGALNARAERIREANGGVPSRLFTRCAVAGIAQEPILLGEDEYFVIGRSPDASRDSRFSDIGNIRKSEILGTVWLRYSPFSRFGSVSEHAEKESS